MPLRYKVSNTTTCLSASMLPSNVNTTSAVPFACVGVNTVWVITCWPFTSKGEFVSLSIKIPCSVYSTPTFRFSYCTVSIMVTCGATCPWLVPVWLSFAVVWMVSFCTLSLVKVPKFTVYLSRLIVISIPVKSCFPSLLAQGSSSMI